jgi:hypothetical protein
MRQIDREHMNQYLQDMIKDKPKGEPIEKTLLPPSVNALALLWLNAKKSMIS